MKPGKYGPFPYSAITRRPRLELPEGAQLAFWIIPNYEFFPLDEKCTPGSAVPPPDVISWSVRDYGNRVGAFRLMKVLDRYKLRATVALNSELCVQHPELIEEGNARGWEWMGHGQSNTRPMKSVQDEPRVIRDALATIAQATGSRPVGWLGPALQETWNTLDCLADENVEYVCDWVNDDQPYLMNLERGRRIVAMPYTLHLNDKIYESSNCSSGEFGAMIKRQFDVLYREGAESGRVMSIAYHPYLSGVAHRIDDFDAALEHICRHEGVWLATGSEIARHFVASSAGKG